jgi:uncharacterized protein
MGVLPLMFKLRLQSEGRGTHYSPVRGMIESTLRVAYQGDWPAQLWALVPHSCQVKCVRHSLPFLSPGSKPLRLGFVSDVHLGPTTPARLLENAFAELASAELDILLLGGDYVFLDATKEKADALARHASTVPAKQKFAVLGNHDLWTHHGMLERAFESSGIRVLDNQHVRLDAHPEVVIAGIDDPWTGNADARAALSGVRPEDKIIVLCHSPDGLPLCAAALQAHHLPQEGSLYVCGHTHGGHIATPWGAPVVPGPMGKRFPHGQHKVGPFHLHVSRGIGGIELPIRTYAPPEVAVFDLLAKTSNS